MPGTFFSKIVRNQRIELIVFIKQNLLITGVRWKFLPRHKIGNTMASERASNPQYNDQYPCKPSSTPNMTDEWVNQPQTVRAEYLYF